MIRFQGWAQLADLESVWGRSGYRLEAGSGLWIAIHLYTDRHFNLLSPQLQHTLNQH